MALPKTLFKRKIYPELLNWKSQGGKTAILIEGARRVGKSVLAETFAENEYVSHMLIDFSKASRSVVDLFDDINDLDGFFQRLQLEYGKKLIHRKSVLIFDEVQFCPKARAAIKHLVADGRYDYMETGSLLSIKKNVQGILIPSEETRISLHPLDFEEFKWALGEDSIPELLREWAQSKRKKPFSEPVTRKLMREFRQYMLCGGMPQAVAAFIETNNWEVVDGVKRNILNLYADDLRKIDATGRISAIFSAFHPNWQGTRLISIPELC